MRIFNIINFMIDFFSDVKDIWDTWRDKEEKIWVKIIFTIIGVGLIIWSAKIWL